MTSVTGVAAASSLGLITSSSGGSVAATKTASGAGASSTGAAPGVQGVGSFAAAVIAVAGVVAVL